MKVEPTDGFVTLPHPPDGTDARRSARLFAQRAGPWTRPQFSARSLVIPFGSLTFETLSYNDPVAFLFSAPLERATYDTDEIRSIRVVFYYTRTFLQSRPATSQAASFRIGSRFPNTRGTSCAPFVARFSLVPEQTKHGTTGTRIQQSVLGALLLAWPTSCWMAAFAVRVCGFLWAGICI